LPHKQYSGNEIESVIIDSGTLSADEIDTEASYATVRRWIKQIGERVRQAIGKLKYHFGRDGQAVSEAAIYTGHCYSELEQVLEKAPTSIKCSGNKLGLANIWLRATDIPAYI
jgi:glutathione S-transferase